MKKNCWEILGCEKKDCPATSEKRLNGVHDGLNAGRVCWVVAGTRCKDKVSGTFAQKMTDCKECRVYQLIAKEEGMMFKPTLFLLSFLQETLTEEVRTEAVRADKDVQKILNKFKAGESGTIEDLL